MSGSVPASFLSCGVCGSQRATPVLDVPRGRSGAKCLGCGVVHLFPRATSWETDEHQLKDADAHARQLEALRPGFEREDARLLARIASVRPPPGRLLDVGAGTGWFLRAARTHGWQVVGLEPAAFTPQDGLEIVRGTIEQAPFSPKSFDVVTMTQVIEHLIDPLAGICTVAGWLSPGGVLAIETPNANGLSRRLRVSAWRDLNLGDGHTHLFHRRALRALCRRAGLEVLDDWTFFKALSVSRAAVRAVWALNAAAGPLSIGNNVGLLARKRG